MSKNVRRTRDEVTSTCTYVTVGSDENETSSEAMWPMLQQRHEHWFTTEDLKKLKTNLENGKDIDPDLLRNQLYIRVIPGFCIAHPTAQDFCVISART